MPPADLPPLPQPAEYTVVARPGAARVARRERWTAFGLLALVSLAVASAFAAAGAWPVLPYSALELALVALAFAVVERRARDWERLTVAGDRVIVERSSRGRCERREFNRQWLRVELERARGVREPRLTLRYAGQAMDFGGALPPGQRAEVARTLRRLTAAR
jgi:uncharacterized membrane protein